MNSFGQLIPAFHAGATLFMAGLIWFVQLVHYPLFKYVDRERFVEFEQQHQKRTTWIVAPVMLLELATAVVLLFDPPAQTAFHIAWFGMALLVAIWSCTALVQMRMHQALANGYSDRINRRLVLSNWIRTIAWSARAVLAVLLLDLERIGG